MAGSLQRNGKAKTNLKSDTVLSKQRQLLVMKKFCGRCKKELPTDAEYLLCEECHRRTILSEEDREFYENSRLHY